MWKENIKMKKIIFILFIMGLLVVSGCDDEENIDKNNIKEVKEGNITLGQQTEFLEETVKEETKSKETLIQIPFENANNGYLYGNKIVFNDHTKSSNSNTWDRNIFLYDILSKEIAQITIDNSDQMKPFIYENTIVWFDNRFSEASAYYGVFMYDVNEGVEKNLDSIPIESRLINNLMLYDNTITFTSGSSLVVYNINSEEIRKFEHKFQYGWGMGRYKNKIVWTNEDGLYLFDTLTKDTTEIKSESYIIREPCIFEDKIVWSDNRNGKNNFDLYMLNLNNGEETQITNFQDTSEKECSIYKDNVVYIRTEVDDSNSAVYLYNINSKENKEVSKINTIPFNANLQIFENKIMWQDSIQKSYYGQDDVLMLYTF